MTFHQLHLICFATGSVIHGTQTALVAKRWRQTTGENRSDALEGLAIGVTTFLWQFGNFFTEFVSTVGFTETTFLHSTGDFIRTGSLICFPLLFSSMCGHVRTDLPAGRSLVFLGRLLRYPLWLWTPLAIVSVFALEAGFSIRPVDPNRAVQITLHLMLVYFLIFTVTGFLRRQEVQVSGVAAVRAHRAGVIAAFVAAAMFVLMLGGYWHLGIPYLSYIELAAMMTSVPFTIAVAYRLYQFPFMDTFLREVLSGLMLLAAFVAAYSIGTVRLAADLMVLWIVVTAMLLAYAKEPLTRWVERAFLGYQESVEEQEERVGNAIRALTRLDEFGTRVSEILRSVFEAEWVEIGVKPRSDAVHRFELPGSSPLWMSVGPRAGGRQYMSRQLRLARTAALQLAAHHQQLSQHDLRELTARAQMRALQAQINPHFLFNTLNVLSNLIHTNPAKAERLTEELADIFRYALESTRLEWVKLDDELRFLESYLEIEKARFEERLAYSFELEPSIRSLKIPPMILQPLVENAIKHGISPKVEGGKVRIAASLKADGGLAIVVEDSGVGHRLSRQRGTGIGLSNVRARLQHIYGDSVTLKLEEASPSGTRALLILPQMVGVHP
jgi:signal transduction histidine kinase